MIDYNDFSKQYMEINDNSLVTSKEQLQMLYEIWIRVNISFNKIKKKQKKMDIKIINNSIDKDKFLLEYNTFKEHFLIIQDYRNDFNTVEIDKYLNSLDIEKYETYLYNLNQMKIVKIKKKNDLFCIFIKN